MPPFGAEVRPRLGQANTRINVAFRGYGGGPPSAPIVGSNARPKHNEMLRHDENIQMAAEYLAHIGRLERCDAHGTIFGGAVWELEDDFYKRVMYDRNRGANGPVPWAAAMGAREYTDLLKEAYERYPGEACFSCEKNMAD